MVISILVSYKITKCMVMGYTNLKITLCIKGNSETINFKGKES